MTCARTTLILFAAASTAACASSDIAVRSIPGSNLQADAAPSARVAEGHIKLAMGSVGLAIESFRRALRDEPSSVDAFEGLGLAYERLGRFDLASRQYEAALAVDPKNPALLAQLASSRDAEGKSSIASDIRKEMAAIQASEAATKVPPTAVIAQTVGQDARLSLPKSEPAALPTVQPITPRLVRLTLGEIALVTQPGPLWERSMHASRHVSRPAEIRLLNAARVERLAARTKTLLSGGGWSNITVGDAPAVRSESVIKFPAHARTAAARLSAQYGIKAEVDPQARFITVYLGSDSVGRVSQSSVA